MTVTLSSSKERPKIRRRSKKATLTADFILTLEHNFEELPSAFSGRDLRHAYYFEQLDLSVPRVSFEGWQKQPGLKTVQSLVEGSLGKCVDEKKAQLLKDIPVQSCAVVAGRTDKGALQQVCSIYTWRKVFDSSVGDIRSMCAWNMQRRN